MFILSFILCLIFFSRIPLIGKYLARLIPIVNYRNNYKLSEKLLKEWSFLDTYDNWSPKYDFPQSKKTIKSWKQKVNLSEIEVLQVGHLVLRAKKN